MASERDKYSSGIKNSLNDNDPINDDDFDWNEIEDQYDREGRRRGELNEEQIYIDNTTRNRSIVVLAVAVLLFWMIDWSPTNVFDNVRGFFSDGIAGQGLVESSTESNVEASEFGFIQYLDAIQALEDGDNFSQSDIQAMYQNGVSSNLSELWTK